RRRTGPGRLASPPPSAPAPPDGRKRRGSRDSGEVDAHVARMPESAWRGDAGELPRPGRRGPGASAPARPHLDDHDPGAGRPGWAPEADVVEGVGPFGHR